MPFKNRFFVVVFRQCARVPWALPWRQRRPWSDHHSVNRVRFYYPTNGQTFTAPASVAVHALVLDSTVVRTVQYFASGTTRGRTNTGNVPFTNSTQGNPFELTWTNVVAGLHSGRRVAMDASGTVVTSATSKHYGASAASANSVERLLYYPDQWPDFAPANVALHALVLDSIVVKTVQYFSNGTNKKYAITPDRKPFTNSAQSNPFELTWSNVVAGGLLSDRSRRRMRRRHNRYLCSGEYKPCNRHRPRFR